ncbi:predicted protein [Nematostella vectensis]|uniref:Palmitoyltransferase n=1 Tax=Nematostella vectensis TaxID=45351 RepID=A7SWQ7_NEMVE|nr:predicted protein [Nematostella vectensis]|eukprot:XP_001623964.1 predicted protein [Nematostella vectensis]
MFSQDPQYEKLSLAKRVIPKKGSDAAAFVFMFVMLWVISLFELLVVLPIYHEFLSTWYLIHVFCGLFMFLNVFANLYKVITTDTTGAKLGMPSVLKPGWAYCPFCQLNSPPRAYHCHVCDICVLRRDHHCIFAGKCVGHSNYRYYLFLAFYLWLGALYANLFHWEYVTSVMDNFTLWTMFTMFMPMLSWMLGYTTIYQTFVTFITAISLFAFVMFSGLLFFQLNIIARGQTSYERKRKRRIYDKGWLRNFIEVLGENWFLSWIWPKITSPLPHNGTDYTQACNEELPKDM